MYKLTNCAYEPTYEIYIEKLDSLVREGGKKVVDYLDDILVENWCNAFFRVKDMVRRHQALLSHGVKW